MARFMEDRFYDCPYYRLGDEHLIVSKQMSHVLEGNQR